MRTTITMAVLRGSQVIIANIGDSRTTVTNHELRLITRDHSLVAPGFRRPDFAKRNLHPSSTHVIYRYLGQKDEIQPDLYRYFMHRDKLLLCSDGLWEMIRSEAEIANAEKASDRSKLP